MRKSLSLLLVLLLAAMMLSGVAVMQDAPAEEVDVVTDLLLPRLEEYNANMPKGYGTIKIEDLLVLLMEEDVTLLDVREDAEVEEFGIIEDAVHIPIRTLGENLAYLPDQDATIVVICKGGFRATIAMTALHVLGYENAKVLVGGFDAWVGEELPVAETAAEYEAAEVPEAIDPLLLEHVSDYLATLPEGYGGVKADALFEQMFDAPPEYLIDVRSEEEWNDVGYIDGATHLWIDEFIANLEELPEDLDSEIVVYCASSYRGGIAATMLGLMGYTDVRNLSGGINAWLALELPVEEAS